MLLKTFDKNSGKVLVRTKTLLTSAQDGYTRPSPGKGWFATTTTVWKTDEIIRRRVRDWRRLTGETGHTGERTGTFRKDHDSAYTGTHSVFPAPLVEWILLRYGGPPGGRILDAFAGGPPRGVVATIMGYQYVGLEIRQAQIDENIATLKRLKLWGKKPASYLLANACYFGPDLGQFDAALTCPPYYDLEQYSDDPADLSNMVSYEAFNASMSMCAMSHFDVMKPGAFVCIVVGPFRNKKTGELRDFAGHTISNFREAGFIFWQQVVLSKNFASASIRSTNAWRGHKLVPAFEFLLVFRMPGWEK